MRPFACGELAGMIWIPNARAHAPELRQRHRARHPLLCIRRPHIHVLPVGVERPRDRRTRSIHAAQHRRPPPRSFPAPRTAPACGPSHRPPASASSCCGAARLRTRRWKLPSICTSSPKCAFRSRRCRYGRPLPLRDSTAPPPASSAAASRDRPSARLHSPDARPPASAQTARRSRRCTSARISASTRFRTRRRRRPIRRPARTAMPESRRALLRDTGATTASPGDSSRPSTPPPTPTSTSPPPPAPTPPPASAPFVLIAVRPNPRPPRS